MKNLVFLPLLFIAFFIGCNGDKSTNGTAVQTGEDSLNKDSDSVQTDTIKSAIPVSVDELFDDFIYGFTSNSAFQRKRIVFPLKHKVNDGEGKPIQQKKWKFDAIHIRGDYYTVLYNNERQLKKVVHKNLSRVAIELIYPDKKMYRQYVFEQLQNKWFLTSIGDYSLSRNKNAEFYAFYERFVSDSVFQREHVADPLGFVTYDEDNHYERIDGVVDIDQWFVFRPDLPKGVLTNIDYGQPFNDSNKRIFVMHGLSNGMQSVFRFQKIKGSWYLNSFEN